MSIALIALAIVVLVQAFQIGTIKSHLETVEKAVLSLMEARIKEQMKKLKERMEAGLNDLFNSNEKKDVKKTRTNSKTK
jgi:hypothetical protein